MFWKSRAQHNLTRPGLESLRAPLVLDVEVQLRDEMHRCVQAADWGGLKHVLRQLERKKTALGEASVSAIVNSRPSTTSPTALHLVCGRGESYDLASRLLALGAEPDEPSVLITMRNGFPSNDRPTPLYCAIGRGDLKLAKLLLAHGAKVSQQNSLGETPLIFALRVISRWDTQGRLFERALVEAGANPRMADLDGMTPLAEHVINERWAQAAFLVEKFPGPSLITQRAQQKIVDKFLQICLSALARTDQDRSGLRSVLQNLDDLRDGLGANVLSAIFNSSINGGSSLFARMIEFGVPRLDILKAEKLGGSMTTVFDSRIKTTDIKGVAAFHHAVASNDPALIEWALKRVGPWLLKQPVGEQRLSPLHLLYLRCTPINLEAARLLIDAGADPLAVTSSGENLFEMAVAAGDAPGMDLWTDYLTNPYIDASPLIREMMLTDEEFLKFKREFSELGRMRLGLPTHIEREMKAWAGDVNDPAHTKRCREYMQAYYVAKEPSRWARTNPEMYRLLPRAILRKDPMALVGIVKAVDTLNDWHEGARGGHPFQAELMTLLAHPGGDGERDDAPPQGGTWLDSRRELRTAVTLALTSIHRFNNLNIYSVSPATVNFWGRVGVASYSFRYQKWDAHGFRFGDNRMLSLFEQFGFVSLRGEDGQAQSLGAGYELSRERKERICATLEPLGIKFDPNVRIQFFEGCKRAFLPGVGDFIVRNSARSYLSKHPAYFSRLTVEAGLPASDATTLTPSVIEDSFMPVLQSTLYVDNASAVAEMEYLLGHIEAVDRELDYWKFDTRRETAWETIEGIGTVLRGAYYSDGFPKLVDYLTKLAGAQRKKGEQIPELAFFPRHLPAWQPIPYTDLDGKQFTTLELNPMTLELLKKLESSSADRKDFKNDNGRAFHFFQMGLEQGAALVVVDGKEVSHEP